PMVPAGYVSVADDRSARFINLRREYRGFIRSVATTPARFPTGRVAGAVFDRKTGDAIALFHSFDLAPGQRVRVTPMKQSGAGVFVVLRSPQVPHKKVDLVLHVNAQTIAPDDIVDGGIRTYAFWYSVKGTTAKLEVINDTVTYDGPDLILHPGAVT